MVCFGVDIGGTGCKCAAFDEDGVQLALCYKEYPVRAGTDRLDALVLWQCVCRVIADCAQTLPNPNVVTSMAISSFGESFVALDACAEPLEDIALYFSCQESKDFAQLVETVGARRIMEITRLRPEVCYSLARMLQARRTARAPVWKYLFVASFVCFRLCGETVCDGTLASRSLLYDVRAGDWSGELLDAAGIARSQLPDIVPTGAVAGTIWADVARQLGLPPQVKIVVGAHDQIVNALGAGVSYPGDAVDITGTCECITPLFAQIPDETFVRNNFACVPYVGGRGYASYAYNVSAGQVVRWYRDTLGTQLCAQGGCTGYELFNRLCPAEPTSLIVLPYLQGMGATPDNLPSLTGQITGLTLNTTLPVLYRGILEGLCFEMAYNLEKLSESGVETQRLYACGGGARSPIWLQIKADVWGREIIPVQSEETGALGSAILAFAAVMGCEDPFVLAKHFVRSAQPIRPNAANHSYYQAQYEAFKRLRACSVALCRGKELNIN